MLGCLNSTEPVTTHLTDEEYFPIRNSGSAQLQGLINSEPNAFDDAADVSAVDDLLETETEDASAVIGTANDAAMPDPLARTVLSLPPVDQPLYQMTTLLPKKSRFTLSFLTNHDAGPGNSTATRTTPPDNVNVNVEQTDTPDLHSVSEPLPDSKLSRKIGN